MTISTTKTLLATTLIAFGSLTAVAGASSSTPLAAAPVALSHGSDDAPSHDAGDDRGGDRSRSSRADDDTSATHRHRHRGGRRDDRGGRRGGRR